MRSESANRGRNLNSKLRRGRPLLAFLVVVVGFLVAPRHTRSQTAAPKAGATPAPVSQSILYGQVFKHVAFLDNQADLVDQRGGNGAELRNYYQVHATLAATEAALLKSTSHDAVTAVQAVDQQIKAVIVSYRAQFRNGKWPRNTPLPPPPPELKTLQATKDNIIQGHLTALQAGFGSDRFQHFDGFVQTAIAPHITVTTLAPPTLPGGTPPPLQPIQWK
jgi:hypothetical protein